MNYKNLFSVPILQFWFSLMVCYGIDFLGDRN